MLHLMQQRLQNSLLVVTSCKRYECSGHSLKTHHLFLLLLTSLKYLGFKTDLYLQYFQD